MFSKHRYKTKARVDTVIVVILASAFIVVVLDGAWFPLRFMNSWRVEITLYDIFEIMYIDVAYNAIVNMCELFWTDCDLI